ncbi:DUF6225 family protein [Streptomyces lavendulae]|uniref:Uncharacterized protein n=1 Tax=Streptomyces lavendulae subsp. lavendulae TaxID=58340 RepID=A0A2K8P757_STRLA|nr:DUF6225 family protein [Streptomyces lavendulae]ATZ22571.1 hypothetical protein SLAV_03310 [Streptomyces lavendulae subsp. lavendulae]QUQ52413.1 hypothetical protein SLLC_01345 [Streptomyces lavendulae subsp. lavendulae]GLV96432.1 hypothetical protein Slala05_00640 [Streptomyces lavendulae subsp. lavendulae]GLX34013.1 hypothetical protein Sros01_00860 [Streptomyces roseochromogenus]
MADMFDHAPQVWTAARLRAALADLPDETPIHIGVADGPGDFEGYGEYVLVDAEPVEVDSGDDPGGEQVQFTLFADARAGAYHLDVD